MCWVFCLEGIGSRLCFVFHCMLSNIHSKSKWSVFLSCVFWLSWNRFCNLCTRGNIQIHLILFLQFGKRNTCKPGTINWTKFMQSPAVFTRNLGKSHLNAQFNEACDRVQKSWFLLSLLFHPGASLAFLTYSIATTETCELRGRRKKIDAKIPLESNNVIFNPRKSTLIPHLTVCAIFLFWSSFLGRDFVTEATWSDPTPWGLGNANYHCFFQ